MAVAFAGISLYQRFRNRRSSSKSLPRIIEIGALANRKPKSPSYARHDPMHFVLDFYRLACLKEEHFCSLFS